MTKKDKDNDKDKYFLYQMNFNREKFPEVCKMLDYAKEKTGVAYFLRDVINNEIIFRKENNIEPFGEKGRYISYSEKEGGKEGEYVAKIAYSEAEIDAIVAEAIKKQQEEDRKPSPRANRRGGNITSIAEIAEIDNANGGEIFINRSPSSQEALEQYENAKKKAQLNKSRLVSQAKTKKPVDAEYEVTEVNEDKIDSETKPEDEANEGQTEVNNLSEKLRNSGGFI